MYKTMTEKVNGGYALLRNGSVNLTGITISYDGPDNPDGVRIEFHSTRGAGDDGVGEMASGFARINYQSFLNLATRFITEEMGRGIVLVVDGVGTVLKEGLPVTIWDLDSADSGDCPACNRDGFDIYQADRACSRCGLTPAVMAEQMGDDWAEYFEMPED